MRRLILITMLLAGSATLLAAERATFILNDGQRVNGVLSERTVARGFFRRNPDFVVYVNNRQVQVPLNDVAVIDFSGGRPAAAELRRIPTNGNQLMVLRDGTTLEGRLLSMLGSDAVRWGGNAAPQEDIPISAIRRLYLNPGEARRAYNYNVGGPQSPAYRYGTQGQPYDDRAQTRPYMYSDYSDASGALLTPPNGMAVRANVPWTDTGVNVRAGDVLNITASGRVAFATGDWAAVSPDGNATVRRDTYPLRGQPVGALIGRIGSGTPFLIGANARVSMPATGRLVLGVNDDERNDNSGAFKVVIRRDQ
jgi:hypothetical protein